MGITLSIAWNGSEVFQVQSELQLRLTYSSCFGSWSCEKVYAMLGVVALFDKLASRLGFCRFGRRHGSIGLFRSF